MRTLRVAIPYTPRPLQREVHEHAKRFTLLVCHRRFGKTVLAINHLLRSSLTCPLTRPRFAYVAPTYRQAKLIAWDYLRHYAGAVPHVRVNESELRIDLPNQSRISLFGAENYDALRGTYLDGVVLDEYGLMHPAIYKEVIRPAISDRRGWLMFLGTPKGRNAFYELYQAHVEDPAWFVRVYKASETGVLPPEELEAARRDMGDAAYEQEYECSWTAAITGAYYARELAQAEAEGRVTDVPHDPTLPVHTAWDLGMDDATAILFFQRAGREVRIIDYYEASGMSLAHYAKTLQQRPYVYGEHILPHDVEVRELTSGQSRLETLYSLGVNATVAPKRVLEDGIEAVRSLFPRLVIDRRKCAHLIEALRNYRAEYDDKRQVLRMRPVHDWASHAADALRYLALMIDDVGNDYAAMLSQPAVGVL